MPRQLRRAFALTTMSLLLLACGHEQPAAPTPSLRVALTPGARTVVLKGKSRTFVEGTITVRTDDYVYLLPQPYSGTSDTLWLRAALEQPDLIAIAMEYVGVASYGPLLSDGTREEGADFNDYLGIAWNYDGTIDQPETRQLHSLDCSGFVRMVYGYRAGVRLSLSASNSTLGRRAHDMWTAAPGIRITADASNLKQLAPGDLVFFDADSSDGAAIDHIGIYIGTDTNGLHRFLSSRKTANGPTFADLGGRSVLEGTGLYATALRGARRL